MLDTVALKFDTLTHEGECIREHSAERLVFTHERDTLVIAHDGERFSLTLFAGIVSEFTTECAECAALEGYAVLTGSAGWGDASADRGCPACGWADPVE